MGEKSAHVGIVFVNYNTSEQIVDCLNSFDSTRYQVVVVDNASPNDDIQAIKLQFPLLHIIESNINAGFGQGCNQGAQWLIDNCEVEFILFLNPDTRLGKSVIDLMLNEFTTDVIGAVAPRIVTDTMVPTLWYGGGEINWIKGSATVPASLAGIGLLALSIFTGSRSAIVAIVLVVVMTFLFQAIRWASQGHLSKLVLGISFGLPLLLITSAVAVEYLGLDSRLILGRSINEAQSSAARVQMLVQGIPMIMEHPLLGYGIGLSGLTLGFVGGGQITIDNFYLSLALDAGLPGMLIFIAICLIAIIKAVSIGGDRDPEVSQLGIYLAISIIGMLTVKTILSIPYNLPLLFLATIVIFKMSDIRLGK